MMLFSNQIILVLWFLMLFAGAKVMKRGQWNPDALSYDQTKAVLGFCAVGVVIHHCAEKTSAWWLPAHFIDAGLKYYVGTGFPLVAFFLFCSGYGMWKSSVTRKDPLAHFWRKRYAPILCAYFITLIGFIILMKVYNVDGIAPLYWSPHSWYIFCILFMYLFFWLGLRFLHEQSHRVMLSAVGLTLWLALCLMFGLGNWWSNTSYLFVLGMLFAKHEEAIISHLKRFCIPYLVLSIVITIPGFIFGNYTWPLMESQGWEMSDSLAAFIINASQIISGISFVLFMILLNMKVRIGNPVLKFYGKMTLELYLVHGIFSELFGRTVMADHIISNLHIKNCLLYVFVVLLISSVLAFLLRLINDKIRKV